MSTNSIGQITTISEVSAEWTAVCDEGATSLPFLRPEWFTAFADSFGEKIEVLSTKKETGLTSILPLMSASGSLHGVPVRILRSAHNLNTPRFDLIHTVDPNSRRESTRDLWDSIKNDKSWDVLEFRLVPHDSWLHDILHLADNDGHRTGVWEMDGAPFVSIPIGDTVDDALERYFSGSRKRFKKELDRRLRRLQEIGRVEFCVTDQYDAATMKTFFDVESSGWKGREGTAASNDPNVVRLHEDFASSLAERRALSIYQLKLDDTTIAISLNILFDDKIAHWKTAYDETFSQYAPGNLLFRELLRNGIRDGISEIDMLSPALPYKLVWSTGVREHSALYVFRKGLVGKLLWAWKFKFALYLRRFAKKR